MRPHSDNGSTNRVLHQAPLGATEQTPDALGRAAEQPRADLLEALNLPNRGEIFDLDPGRWPGMPVLPVHPPFLTTTFRTPRGSAVDGDGALHGNGLGHTGFITELMVSSAHSGAHVDAMCHITRNSTWFGAGSESDHLGDFGATQGDASVIPPFVCRGVLIDVASLHGVEALPAGHVIDRAEIAQALDRQGVAIRQGDAVLVRTGYMSQWLDPVRRERHFGAGLGVAAAIALADAGTVLVGCDTENLEVIPSESTERFLPVHVELMVERGIYIAELLYLEQIAAAGVGAFLFICLPLRIRGASGSMVRAIGLV